MHRILYLMGIVWSTPFWGLAPLIWSIAKLSSKVNLGYSSSTLKVLPSLLIVAIKDIQIKQLPVLTGASSFLCVVKPEAICWRHWLLNTLFLMMEGSQQIMFSCKNKLLFFVCDCKTLRAKPFQFTEQNLYGSN